MYAATEAKKKDTLTCSVSFGLWHDDKPTCQIRLWSSSAKAQCDQFEKKNFFLSS